MCGCVDIVRLSYGRSPDDRHDGRALLETEQRSELHANHGIAESIDPRIKGGIEKRHARCSDPRTQQRLLGRELWTRVEVAEVAE